MCSKLRTVAASNNRDHARNLSYYCLLALHMWWCYSSRTSRSWWITQSTHHHRRGCNTRMVKSAVFVEIFTSWHHLVFDCSQVNKSNWWGFVALLHDKGIWRACCWDCLPNDNSSRDAIWMLEITTEQSLFRNFNNNLLTIVHWSEARKFMSPQVEQ